MSGLPLISRRRLLTAMALSPLLWQMNTAHAAVIDPNRIVALEWLPVELLLALGIVPYGVADTINYRLWVSEPPLPETVVYGLVCRIWPFTRNAGTYCAGARI